MSTADITITNQYWEMLRFLNDEVKLRLAGLLTASVADNYNSAARLEDTSDYPASAPYTLEELHARIKQSEEDIKAGRVYTMEEVEKELEAKYPWLCE